MHNAVSMWKGLKKKMGEEAEKPCTASALALAVGVGADFLMYGPVEDAKVCLPGRGDGRHDVEPNFIERGGQLEKSHPRFRIG